MTFTKHFAVTAVSLMIAIILLTVISCDTRTTEAKPKIESLVFTPAAGSYIDSVLVTITCETDEVAIYYTLDETEPQTSSLLYTNPILIDSTVVLKARAFRDKWEESNIRTGLYEIDYSADMETVSPPVFTPPAGNYADSVAVVITCDTENALIYYTVDGSEPTELSFPYTVPIILSETVHLKARAFREGWLPSSITSSIYSVLRKVATPSFNPAGGEYDESIEVAVFCTTADAQIYYTTDGTEPSEQSELYTQPLFIEETTSLRARAYKDQWLPSDTALALFNIEIELETVAAPTFDPPEGQYNEPQQVEIFCATPDVQIRYTTSGIEPTENSNLYSAPVAINAMTTLRARAFKEGWNPSSTAVAVYDMKVATPTFDPPAGIYEDAQLVEILCSTPDVEIRYTLDGSDPNFLSDAYTEPVSIARDTVIKARAFKSSWTPGDIADAAYIIDYPQVPDMILVDFGTFQMGDARGTGDPNERPVHNVTLTSFYIGKYQVTQKQWEDIMGNNPSGFEGENRPVDSISWYWALVYCNRRSIAEGLTPVYTIDNSTDPDDWPAPPQMGYSREYDRAIFNTDANGYRLPTEAEWEYAARAATNIPDYIYAGSDNVNDVAWHNGNSQSTTHPVGLKSPNALDIYDLSGNVWEWCWDWSADDYYENSPENNPTGPDTGSFRVIRGGSYAHASDACRVSKRMNGFPYRANSFMGLRVVRSVR